MNPRLQELFDQIEEQRLYLLTEIRPVSEERLNHSRNRKWSISQIAGHLISAEQLSLSYMAKKINAIDEVGNTGILGELKLLVFQASQRLPLKYKAPKSLGEQPKSYQNFNSLELDWNQSREQLKVFLEKIPSNGLKKKIYRHPVMGRCNIIHALVFFREHIIHHYPQIKRQL